MYKKITQTRSNPKIFSQYNWPNILTRTFFIIILVLGHLSGFSQQIINGTVTSVAGEPLPGVSVKHDLSGKETITDANGMYSIDLSTREGVLVFSFIGLKTQKIPILEKQQIDVQLESTSSNLGEVVIVGYGEQSRETLTTSISKLDEKVLENVPYSHAGSALQGTLSGVRVQSTSGQPGAAPRVIIRGGTSINNPNGSSPLYIVDGVIRPTMDNISGDDIESLQVLKDAASTAIYGARGSNGVVIITTKSGRAGRAEVSYKYSNMISQEGKLYDFVSARDFITLTRLGSVAGDKFPDISDRLSLPIGYGTGNDLTNNTAFTTQYLNAENEHKLNEGWESMPDPLDPTKTIIFKDTDFQDLTYRTGISHNHHLEVNGGSEKATFNAGLGYLTNQGTVITTMYDRLSFNLNGALTVKDNLSFFGRILYSSTESNGSPHGNHITFYRNAGIPPTTKYAFEDGTLAPGANFAMGNPVYHMNTRVAENKSDNLTLSLGSHWEILPGLSFDPQVSLYNVSTDGYTFQPGFWNGPLTFVDTRNASAANYRWRQTQADGVFTYTKSIIDHNLTVNAGFSYFGRKESRLSANGRGASTDLIPTLNASSEPTSVNSTITDQRIIGYFARANYDFDRKYLLSVSLRYDGASNLGDNNKWGAFPGVSLGWNMHKEKFWEALPEGLSKLKLRASYGVNGNISRLSDFAAQGSYSVGSRYGGVAAVRNTVMANQDLKWEQSKTFDVGADVDLFNGRVSVLFDYYRRVTDNLITNFTLPPSTGFSSILTNLGSLENIGFEFEVGVNVLNEQSPVRWNLAFNASKVKNKILSLPPNGTERNRVGGFYVWDDDIQDYSWQGGLQEGGTIGDLFAYKQIGIYATDEEAQAGPIDNIITFADKTKYGGDVNWLDADKNGVIDQLDRVNVGNIYPTWTGGMSTSLGYKNFSLYARLDYTVGHTIYNYARAFTENNWQGDGVMTQRVMDKSWKKQGDITDVPRHYWFGDRAQQNNIRGNSAYYESGDFLALREVTLSYMFSPRLLERIKLKNLKLHVTGNNLYYFTKYMGLNPEDGGQDNGRYAVPRNLIFGATVSF